MLAGCGKKIVNVPSYRLARTWILSNNDHLHVHILVAIATDHGTYDFVFPRLGGHFQDKFLGAGFELEVPVRKFRAILFSDESEAMNRSVPVEVLRLPGSDSKLYFFACLQCQGWTGLFADLEEAVV